MLSDDTSHTAVVPVVSGTAVSAKPLGDSSTSASTAAVPLLHCCGRAVFVGVNNAGFLVPAVVYLSYPAGQYEHLVICSYVVW